jgi:hypothetical protein
MQRLASSAWRLKRYAGARGEAPKKCSTFSERSQHVLWDLWSTLIVTPDFSSDLERGAVPRSIADEKSGVTVLVIELHWSQDSEHFRSPAVFLGILPSGGQSRRSSNITTVVTHT